jgi:membrane-bound ClpP family serine protease
MLKDLIPDFFIFEHEKPSIMFDWIAIIILVLFGLGFIIAEIIFVPGTTLLGLVGIVFTIAGIVISYLSFGAGIGTLVLTISLVVGISVLIYSFKSGVWDKFALKTSINSKFNEGNIDEVQVGEEGITLSALRPVGKADFRDKIFEVTTLGNFLPSGTKVRVVSIKNNKIFIEPIK